ncbi:hypothetical protein HOLleu_19300 [Holothuria leucospilota]|uniref:Uncharacterized protein n=1 Tax=Holothuria leucospilota TaxID=206669 RepID=A0A9Q1H4W4_HOLLE|nr:hypothetical protein HOLleu_19300 [Holothuria leucospilota]
MPTRQSKQSLAEVASLVIAGLLSSDAFKALIEKSVLKAFERKIDNMQNLIDKLKSRIFHLEQKADKNHKSMR